MLRAPWLTQDYVKDPMASDHLWAGGYLHTSDVAALTPEGYVRITDRMKDVIKTGGEWVSLLQIEDLITHHAGVAEAAVIGLKDEVWGERPMALVVRDASVSEPLGEADVKAHLKVFAETGIISKYGVPDRIVFVDGLPRTSVGKIDKKKLREQYGDA